MAQKKSGSAPKKKTKQPARLRARQVNARTPQATLMEQANEMVAAQAQSPVGSQLTNEIADVKAAITAVGTANTAHDTAAATLATAQTNVITAEDGLVDAMNAYAQKAVKISKNDPAVVKTTAVQTVSNVRQPKDTGPAAVVTGISAVPWKETGQSKVHWKRPPGAAAFIAQYMLEPTSPPAPGAPPPQWLPSDGYSTKNVEWIIDGLPPAANLRVRIRAIGAELGPWSDEVLGKAR